MKFKSVILLSAACLLLGGITPAWSDEVDDLFAPDAGRSSLSRPVEAAQSDTAVSSLLQSDERDARADDSWNVTGPTGAEGIVLLPPADETRAKHSTVSDAPSGASSLVSAVPEPSAVALAALALIYFLLFGRRPRVA